MKFAVVFSILASLSPVHAADEKAKAPVVLVSPAKLADLFDVLTYPARVIPKINANVLSEVEGVVVRIDAPLGRSVARKEKLMVVKHTDPVYQYAPVTVTAPVAGVVSSVDVTEGSLVSKGSRLATVTDPSKVRITVEIAATDLAFVKEGLAGELRVVSNDAEIKVRVRGISPFVDPATGTATCELELENAADRLAPGIVGQVRFKVNQHQGFALPEYAVVYRGTSTFLRVVDAGKARYLPVELGRKARGQVEIRKGLAAGAQVIERASQFVADGDAVTAEAPTEKKL